MNKILRDVFDKRFELVGISETQDGVIIFFVFGFDNHGWKTVLHQNKIHQDSGDSAVAVVERVNANKFIMKQRG
ncbi:MAG: hypothetical protein M3033_03885 [Acidobacteriota bacterium]|nr:hypothetical protein [Acidobacteriota bacterium]